MSHGACADHISLMPGVCYCERMKTVYVYPWTVVPGPRGRTELTTEDYAFFHAVTSSVRRTWPGKTVDAFALLARHVDTHGLIMEGQNPDKLKDWVEAEKRK